MAAVVTAITTVFTAIAQWIAGAIPTIVEIFYTSSTVEGVTTGNLTFLGTLAVIALGISVFFLLMGLIQNFLHFRG